MKNENLMLQKSKKFAIRIINCYKYLTAHNEYVISKQMLRSGTAVGALIAESEFAQSDRDYLNKFYVALKEANETRYWLDLLVETDFLAKAEYDSLYADCHELIKLLVSATKSLKIKLGLL